MSGLKKIIVSFFTVLFFALLILSFTLWGVGDIFRSANVREVARVGNIEITSQEYLNSIERMRNFYQSQVNTPLTNEAIVLSGMANRNLSSMVHQAEMEALAKKIGLLANHQEVVKNIQEIPIFTDPIKNKFDIDLYRKILKEANQKIVDFESSIAKEIVIKQLVSATDASVIVPKSLSEQRIKFLAEERTISALAIPDHIVPKPKEPTHEVLKGFINQYKQNFMSPEYRSFTIVHLKESDFAPDIKISEEDLKKAYEARKESEYHEPKTRDVLVLRTEDQKQAEHIAEQLRLGKSPEILSESLKLVKPVRYKKIVPEDLVNKQLSEQAFKANLNTVRIIKDGKEWLIFQVTEISPEINLLYDEVREKLRKVLISEKAAEELDTKITLLQDEMDSGQSLDNAAKLADLPLSSYQAIDRNGNDREKIESSFLSLYPKILETIFAQKEKGFETELLEDGSGGYYILRVDAIIPPLLKPYENIKDEALTAWRMKEKNNALTLLTADIEKRAQNGESLEDLSKEIGGNVETILVSRLAPTEKIGVELRSKIFALSRNEISSGHSQNNKEQMVVKLVSIEENQEAIAKFKEKIHQNLSKELQSDIVESLDKALKKELKVHINYDLAKNLLLPPKP